jgi:hypothetical protein
MHDCRSLWSTLDLALEQAEKIYVLHDRRCVFRFVFLLFSYYFSFFFTRAKRKKLPFKKSNNRRTRWRETGIEMEIGTEKEIEIKETQEKETRGIHPK